MDATDVIELDQVLISTLLLLQDLHDELTADELRQVGGGCPPPIVIG